MKLFNHQVEGISFLKNRRRCILGDDMGLGKTAQAIHASNEIPSTRILIICPSIIKNVWKTELRKWVDEDSLVIEGTRAERDKLFIEAVNYKYIIINYDLVHSYERNLTGRTKLTATEKKVFRKSGLLKTDIMHIDQLIALQFNCVICDEAHRIKNRKSKTFKAVKHLISKTGSNYIFMLTGTPIMNKPDELWALLNILQPINYRSFWKFADVYCDIQKMFLPKRSINVIVGFKNLEKLRETLKPVLLRREKSDVLDLPEKIFTDIELEFDPAQRKIYDQMDTQLYYELNGKTIEATIALTKLIRLKQICVSHHLLDPESTQLSGIKVDTIIELIEDTSDKVVVFSQFAQCIKRLRPLLESRGIICSGFTGEDDIKYRQEQIDTFKSNTNIKVFLATIQAGGIGLTLTEANTVIFADLMYTPALNAQAADRLHRIGQTKVVNVYTMSILNSIEQDINKILEHKQFLFDATIPVVGRMYTMIRQKYGGIIK
jgi:SNF2 family DNA or RNA helicase